jgi:phosphate starvation-inducible PhoH-like protein
VQTGKSSGLKPGTTLMKLYPYVRNVLDPIKKRIGSGVFENSLKDGETGQIQVQDLESIRGRSFDERSWLLIEEAQQSTPEEMLAIITRVSDDCKIIVSGDLNQKDVKGESGLKWLMDFVNRHKIRGVGFISFDSPDDIVRGGLVRDIAIGLMKEGKLGSNKI